MDGMLSQSDLEAVLATIESALEQLEVKNAGGTVILDGQIMGEEATCLMRFNLLNGYGFRQFQRKFGRTCSDLAAAAIDALLDWPETSYYWESERLVGMVDQAVRPEDLPSGIYCDGDLKVLLLNAGAKRFFFSIYIGGLDDQQDDHAISTAVMQAVARAIALLHPEDTKLQEAAEAVTSAPAS